MRENLAVVALFVAFIAPLPFFIELPVQQRWTAAGLATLAWFVVAIGVAVWFSTRR